jgi:hypothetical protein
MKRWIYFFIAIAIGVAGGLFYGWVLDPVKYVDTLPDSLRIDYKSDYVLMVAETYQAENSLPNAVRSLALVGEEQPVEIVRQALTFAEVQGYSKDDVTTLRSLLEALQSWNPILGTLVP